MTEPTMGATETPIPTCITRCCREWVSPPPGLYGRGKCGLCGESPEFVRMLPRSEWVTPRPPIQPAANTCAAHGDELIHEHGGPDMPTLHGRNYCPTCQALFMAALDAAPTTTNAEDTEATTKESDRG